MVGEHIRTRRDGRWSHAIDCGDETVIHLAESAAGPASVRRSYRPEFVAGADAVEVVTHRERTFPAQEIVARAFSRIADPTLAAMFRDSETFAEWCATGRLPAGSSNVAIGAAPAPAAPPAVAPEPPPARSQEMGAAPEARPERRKGARTVAKRRAPAARTARKAAPARKRAPKRSPRAKPRRR